MNDLIEKRSIDTITAEIQFYKQQAGVSILEIGKRLIEAKDQLSHGEWLNWLEKEVDFTDRSARNFMRLASEYANRNSISDLGVTKALALLSVPTEEREQFAEAVHAEELSVRELKQKIREREDAIRVRETELNTIIQERNAVIQALEEDLNTKRQTINMQTQSLNSLTDEYQALEDRLAAKASELEQTEAALQRAREEPVEVATVTIDATDEQLNAAREQARAFAQDELEAVKRQRDEQVQMTNRLQTKVDEQRRELKRLREEHEDASEDVKINMALGEINGLLREMQSANQRTTELLGNLDEVSRQRVQEIRRKMLRRMGVFGDCLELCYASTDEVPSPRSACIDPSTPGAACWSATPAWSTTNSSRWCGRSGSAPREPSTTT